MNEENKCEMVAESKAMRSDEKTSQDSDCIAEWLIEVGSVSE